MNISVIGLGRLGSPLAAVLADKGHQVIGVDLSENFVNALNEGRPPVAEPGLAELIAKNKSRLSATLDHACAIKSTDITFVIVPTPSDKDGRFSMKYVVSAGQHIGRALKDKLTFHVVVLTSTVMPGDTEGQLLPVLERVSGKKCGRDFGLCYNPEFIALGSVIRDMHYADLTLIGESDPKSGQILAHLHAGVVQSKPLVARMNFINAELTKISINTFITAKISYANMLAEVCEQLPGADVDVVTAAMGSDSRISAKYLRGALGYGGPCFPRDNSAFAAMARQQGVLPLIPDATDGINRLQNQRLAKRLLQRLPKDARVGILGLSYKPDSDVVEHSPALGLARELLAAGVDLVVHDPAAMKAAKAVLGTSVQYAETMVECIQNADFLAVMTPWDEYRKITPEHLQRAGPRRMVFDPWRLLADQSFAEVADLLRVGVGTPWNPAISVDVSAFKSSWSKNTAADPLAESLSN